MRWWWCWYLDHYRLRCWCSAPITASSLLAAGGASAPPPSPCRPARHSAGFGLRLTIAQVVVVRCSVVRHHCRLLRRVRDYYGCLRHSHRIRLCRRHHRRNRLVASSSGDHEAAADDIISGASSASAQSHSRLWLALPVQCWWWNGAPSRGTGQQ
ncbi:hypothetical protein PF008_g11643 [Phytophthora fragariae]|uniref:Secreted protein n=1 Tax=Phytophthora fragariae TaxID=53985 RepID=A0A6G0RQP9_9STRA|nr:hypothetical protein PF008_g11643 [Phytophthora fragariae]